MNVDRWCGSLVGLLVLCMGVAAAMGGIAAPQPQTGDDPMIAGAVPLLEMEPAEGPAKPSWLDDDLHGRLVAGDEVPIDEIEGFPYTATQHAKHLATLQSDDCSVFCPSLPYTHIRPGAALGLSQLACTANFVFNNGDRLAIGTAGHCTVEGERHQTLLVNAQHAIGFRTIGRTIFSTGSSSGVGNDFALIEIHERSHDLVHAGVSLVEGPCGWGGATAGSPMQGFGHGLGWGAGGQSRHGVLLSGGGSSLDYALAPGVSWGDSGSPAVFAVTKEAAAVTTHAIPMTPVAIGTSMPRVFAILDVAGMTGWELVDSPNCLL